MSWPFQSTLREFTTYITFLFFFLYFFIFLIFLNKGNLSSLISAESLCPGGTVKSCSMPIQIKRFPGVKSLWVLVLLKIANPYLGQIVEQTQLACGGPKWDVTTPPPSTQLHHCHFHLQNANPHNQHLTITTTATDIFNKMNGKCSIAKMKSL